MEGWKVQLGSIEHAGSKCQQDPAPLCTLGAGSSTTYTCTKQSGKLTKRACGANTKGWCTHVPHARHYTPWLAYTRSTCQALQAMAGVLKFRMPGTACHGRRTHVPHARHYTPCNSLVNIFRGTTLHVNSFSNNMHVRNKSRCHKKTNKHYTYNYNTF